MRTMKATLEAAAEPLRGIGGRNYGFLYRQSVQTVERPRSGPDDETIARSIQSALTKGQPPIPVRLFLVNRQDIMKSVMY